jgi:murein L,D-transpeptidase YcbB/YkuD
MNQRTPHCSAALFLLTILLAAAAAAESGRDRIDALNRAMAERITCYPLEIFQVHKQKPLIAVKELCLATIYNETGARPLWVTADGPDASAEAILDRLRTSVQEGLDPDDYEVDLLASLWTSRQPRDLARLDTQLTFSLVKYIHDISHGQMKLREADSELYAEAGDEHFDPLLAMTMARSAEDIGAYLDGLAPQHDAYRKLREALASYRELAKGPAWPVIGGGPLIKPGASDSRLVEVRRRLEQTGDFRSTTDREDFYDEPLEAAVKGFQAQHGLKTDGIIGPNTRAALNRPPAELVDVIRANMIRWHIQAHKLGDTHIMVNIAGFRLTAVRDRQTEMEMPVIVGKFQHQTPVFSDKIRYLEFNPYWNITPSIARNEELPALRENPNHLVDRHVRLFSSWLDDSVELDSTTMDWSQVSRSQMSRYKLRQDPGPWNALGRVKFVFPNHHAVYLHDTPSHDLFEQSSRSFSHGCIRVSRPLALAAFLLNGQNGWDSEAIDKVVATGERKIVTLRTPIPVHITYQTSWVDNGGVIHFNGDIYGRDTKLLQTFDARN